ncbi:hypothetical protein RJ639_003052 [Escallonia herrerae]|uniref:Uncharacterized protein n=1 Tax=Escallonia herrerae TaxID=1293975 RepID=A0AA88W2R5_9ASTE|nr:hypothetical protein RJ639_003052 [Escallonia herrerae]
MIPTTLFGENLQSSNTRMEWKLAKRDGNLLNVIRTEAYNFAPNNTLESIEFCNFWREQGAEPIDERGNTVLHFLAIYSNVDAFTKLIRHGLANGDQLKKQNDKGNTALHEAARFGQKDVAEIMLRSERDLVSLSNNLGETPLYIAAAYGKREVFTLLENFNSDCMMSRHDGCTVLHALVLGRYYWKFFQHPLYRIPAIYVESEVSSDVENQNEKREVISSSERSLISCRHFTRNIMHVAVEHKCTDLYEQLNRTIVHKDSLMADIDHEGNTGLHLAANEGHVPNFPLGVLSQMIWDVSWFKL